MYFRPRFADGRLVPLPWQFRLFFINANWPLKDKTTLFQRLLINLALIVEFVSLVVIVEAEINYMRINRRNLGMVLETLLTTLTSTEVFLRIFNMAYKRNGFKKLITVFYAQIYIERTPENALIFDEVQRKSLPTRWCTNTYLVTVVTFFVVPIIGFFKKQQLFPYQMVLHYDYHPYPIYIPTLVFALWAGVNVISHMVAESNTLAALILNLNGSYLILQRELRELFGQLKDSKVPRELFVPKYRMGLVKILRKNYELNSFALDLQSEYSFRIFVLMSVNAIMICTLCLKIVTVGISSKMFTYVLWICAKTVELLIIGEIGSTIIETTSQMSVAYYQCNWEEVILESNNAKDNIELMKVVATAIELNQQPISFTGLNFFHVSLNTVITILQGAGSYFTCIYAFY